MKSSISPCNDTNYLNSLDTLIKKSHGLILTTGFSIRALELAIQEMKTKNSVNKQESHQWVLISRDGNPVESSQGIPVLPHMSIYADIKFHSITLLTGENTSVSPALSIFLKSQCNKGATIATMGNNAHIPLFHFQGKRRPWIICSQLHDISALTHRLLNETSKTYDLEAVDHRLVSAIILMKNNIEEPLPMKELAFHLGISLRHLERLFRRHTNTTPALYYLKIRLWEAKKILKTTKKTLLQTGLACGFSSASHFSRTYRYHFGIPPSLEKNSH